MIEFGHGTHVGLRRTRNEDTYYADATLGLFLVADGMGGHHHGEVAAAIVREAVVAATMAGDDLLHAVQDAAAQLHARPAGHADALPMGSTLAALRIADGTYTAVWAGDSRIYVWHDGLHPASHDEALAQSLMDAGNLAAEAACRSGERSGSTQALGITPATQLHIGLACDALTRRTAILLCTDGLTEVVDDAAIARIMARTDLSAQECVDQLLLKALDAGGDDNVTALLVRCA